MVNYCKSNKSLASKTAIITGANSGIGYETALDFAKRGCRVILGCRNMNKAQEARDKIVKITGNNNVIIKQIDMESLDSVRNFANSINETEDRLDILVNNAGVIKSENKLTNDGLLLEMQVNYFSPYLLTILLLDKLEKSAPSRIVNVSSVLAKMAKFDVKNLNKHKGAYATYGNSKLCMILFTKQLAKELDGTGISVYSLHPGVIKTDIFKDKASMAEKFFNKFSLNAEEGAQTTLYCSLEENIEEYSGRHFDNCKVVKDYCKAKKDKKAKDLWDTTRETLKLN